MDKHNKIYYSDRPDWDSWELDHETGRIVFDLFVIPKRWYSLRQWIIFNRFYFNMKKENETL